MTIIKKIYQVLLHFPAYLLPPYVKERLDVERFSIDAFIKKNVALYVKPGHKVLDAGAGPHRYRSSIKSAGATYVATDFKDVFYKGSPDSYDFVCSLEDIPQPDNTYDLVINTQVLEHIEHPQKVIDELFRILKPGGTLFLTTNQTFWVHHGPYNYFFFTRYGLKALYEQAGFKVDSIEAIGGAAWNLAKIFTYLPSYWYYQTVYTGYKVDESFVPKLRRPVLAIVLLPFYMLAKLIIGTVIPFILFYCDGWDKQKDITLGYVTICTKPQ